MPEFENIFIYVSDALRYDHVPESIAESRNIVPTLVPAGYTPISFSSLVTGLDPRKHAVRSFYDTLEMETVFERFDDHSYYDHPDDAMSRNVMKHFDRKELEDQEPPFIHVERALDTHAPYGQMEHGNEIHEEEQEGSLKEQYRRGVESTEEHFWSHVEELKDRGLYEDTLIIFTSDHGEWLGEKVLGKKRHDHNCPVREELCVVPTVFLNYENSWDRARTIDILPTALSILGKETVGEGFDLRDREPDSGHSMLQVNTHPLIVTGSEWRWDSQWKISKGKLRVDAATKFIDWINPIRQPLRNTKIGDLFGSDNSVQQKFYADDELEGIDF